MVITINNQIKSMPMVYLFLSLQVAKKKKKSICLWIPMVL